MNPEDCNHNCEWICTPSDVYGNMDSVDWVCSNCGEVVK